MLWFGKRPDRAELPVAGDRITAGPLPVALDEGLFKRHFDTLLAIAEQDTGIESYLACLNAKQHRFGSSLSAGAVLDMAGVEKLLASVFTARRRLYPALEALGATRINALIEHLLRGTAAIPQRLQAFVDAMPGAEGMGRPEIKAAAKVRRAAWDFASELLHYSDPLRYPLMARWVWDAGTQSGAMREFVRGGDAMRDIPFDNSPGLFEAGRRWIAERIAAQGIYRDEPLWINLVLAQAYTTYFRSVAEGSLGGDFGRGVSANEQLKKLLGIDDAPSGRARVKKSA
jgi:hypothetical protein